MRKENWFFQIFAELVDCREWIYFVNSVFFFSYFVLVSIAVCIQLSSSNFWDVVVGCRDFIEAESIEYKLQLR